MNRERAVLLATMGILLGITIASGPLVGVSLTESKSFDPGSGSVEAAVTETPSTVTLQRANHGGGVYHLRAEPIAVEVASVAGQPSLTYEVAVPVLGHTTASITFLEADAEGTVQLEFDPSTLEADRIDADQYDGVLTVIANDDGGERVLSETNVTVEVVK